MPGRVSRSSVPIAQSGKPSARPKAALKRKQRGLNAFAIAERQDPLRAKIRQHRFGEAEEEEPRRKRQRVDEDDEDGDTTNPSAPRGLQRNNNKKGDGDELDLSGGSDSEGHEWKMGEVGEDNDSDIDSDEAFGESDEEKFEGFSFGRKPVQNSSESRKTARPARTLPKDVDLDEMDDVDEEEEEDDDFGDEAVDLAAALDENSGSNDDSDAEVAEEHDNPRDNGDEHDIQNSEEDGGNDEEDSSEGGSEDEDSGFEMSEDGSDEDDKEAREQLKDMVASFSKSTKNDNEESENANQNPTLASALAALRESAGLDPAFERQAKNLSRNLRSSKNDRRSNLVHAPLPKRQQDQIDRKAAYGKAKETLNRWIDTVKYNRRAEHLMFPLQDPHAQEPQGKSTMIPTGHVKPQTDLERTIQGILEQSGLGGSASQPEEDQIKGFEELQTKKMPLEEVLARRAELRKARELLFREEVRSKRIKKIKSKAYRRVHRKELQKAAQKERDLLSAAGIDLSEDEKEASDRRRAEERMGARHRESKWAKSVKQTGRAAWDDSARDGVTEMARRNEELRQRMEGKPARLEYDAGSDVSGESEDDDDLDGDATDDSIRGNLEKQLGKTSSSTANGANESKLSSLKFMQRAESARRQQNDEAAESLRRELAGEESESDPDVVQTVPVGRRKFGPTPRETNKEDVQNERNEFEEPEDSGDEQNNDANGDITLEKSTVEAPSTNAAQRQTASQSQKFVGGGLSLATAKPFAPKTVDRPQINSTSSSVSNLPSAPANTEGWTTVQYKAAADDEPQNNEDLDDATSSSYEPLALSNLELVRSAFGGDDVEASFAAEKAVAESSEDEKVTDNALPGWGNWAGEGISKRERKRIQERNKGRFLSKQEGIKPADRKDKDMSKVIISEKRSKKNAKYLASTLPHPFESRQQYERTIRHPIGPEWTTKETFQSSTKPRVLVRPGRRIEPMSTPML